MRGGGTLFLAASVAAFSPAAVVRPAGSALTHPAPATSAAPVRAALFASAALQHYEHDGWDLAFRFKPAAPGHEADPPLLLVHPVGIGLSGWFWDEFTAAWKGGAVYAPDLIGCGESESWDPDQRGIFLPLDWARGCEALWRAHIQRPCVVVAQGGLAPVGVSLAARDNDNWVGSRAVKGLVLCSPPTWAEMVQEPPTAELTRNYQLLRSPLGDAAFGLLERRGFIRFFSDLFLFAEDADERWLDAATAGVGASVRPPVCAFNAGLCNARSFEADLERIRQPTLVVSGEGDKRVSGRADYAKRMSSCTLRSLPGANVVPWEAPGEACAAVAAFSENLE